MAVQSTVAGSGYGNPYVDSLVSGFVWANNGVTGGDIYYAHVVGTTSYGNGPKVMSEDWSPEEQTAFRRVLDSFEAVCNVHFVYAESYAQANMVWYSVAGDIYDDDHQTVGGDHTLPDGTQSKAVGHFRYDTQDWHYLKPGGAGYSVILHEVLHGLGLAHPHLDGEDDAPGHTPFPGVSSENDIGYWGLNQGIWTVMSYNDGWAPAGDTLNWGHPRTPMAFDIAALQATYGANTSWHAGDDVWHLGVDYNAPGYGWFCIWDAGGDDTISAEGMSTGAIIDLRAATLEENDPRAGGRPSYYYAVRSDGAITPAAAHGYTIANGVVIENAVGGYGDDRLFGNNAWNNLTGGAGADRLDGGDGYDTAIYDTTHAAIQVIDMVNPAAGTYDADGDVFRSIERVLGSEGGDYIFGTSDTESLNGRGGNDILWGRAGGADVLDGGSGTDLAGYEHAVTADLMFGYLNTGEAAGDQLLSIEGLHGSAERDVLRGDEEANELYGNGDNDLLRGRGGRDVLDGGPGFDTLWGDQGVDYLIGGSGADTMYGGRDADNYYVDDLGDQVIENPEDTGRDTVITTLARYELGAAIEDLTMTASRGRITGIGNDQANNIMATDPIPDRSDDSRPLVHFTLDGRGGADTLIGSGHADVLVGGADDDWLSPGSEDGSDILVFADGWGHDTVVGFAVGEDRLDLTRVSGLASYNQLVISDLGNGNAKVEFAGNSITLKDIAAADLTAEHFVMRPSFTEQADTIVLPAAGGTFHAHGGHDRLFYIDGPVTIDGGAGSDTVDFSRFEGAVRARVGGEGADILTRDGNDLASGEWQEIGELANVESLAGSAGGDELYGDDNANRLDGNGGSDFIFGNAGDDQLDGGADGDRLDGGAGFDFASYASSAAGVRATLAAPTGDWWTEPTGDAVGDTYVDIEGLIGSEADDYLTGNADANELAGGGGVDHLDGGAGIDILRGGAGDDVYFVDHAGDSIDEQAEQGYDIVYARTASYALAANVEALEYNTYPGVDFHGVGNALGNAITSLGGNDLLEGGDGNDTLQSYGYWFGPAQSGDDTLIGGAGDDWLLAGDGTDTFVVGDAWGHDTIADFEMGVDRLDMRSVSGLTSVSQLTRVDTEQGVQIGFGGNTITLIGVRAEQLADASFQLSAPARIIGTEGDDRLFGTAGTVSMDGRDGNDILGIDSADTEVKGGDGRDMVYAGPSMAASGLSFALAGTDVEYVQGSAGNDVLDASGTADFDIQLFGGSGNDTLIAGSAGSFTMQGGQGTDTAVFSGNRADYAIEVDADEWTGWTLVTHTATGDQYWTHTVEQLQFADQTIDAPRPELQQTGTAGSDMIGGAGANLVSYGLEGNDILTGDSNDDILLGGSGSDQLIGGDGSDSLFVDNQDTLVDGGEGYDTVYLDDSNFAEGIRFAVAGSNVEFVYGGMGNDVIDASGVTGPVVLGEDAMGNGGDDVYRAGAYGGGFDGGDGTDAMVFAGNRADYDLSTYTDNYTWPEDGVMIATIRATGVQIWFSDVETLRFADGTVAASEVFGMTHGRESDDVITGDARAETITGLGGNDVIDGGAGNDWLVGGEGRNELIGGAGNDTLTGGSSFDHMDGGEGNDTLIGKGGQTVMFGGAGDDTMTGSLTSNNSMYGGGGDDTITGGDWTDWISDTDGGNDTIRGGGGYDVIVDHYGINFIFGEGGSDWLISGSNEGSLLDGGEGDDTLFSSFGSNTLIGGAGNDLLENQDGGALNTFTGGAGTDTFIYRAGVGHENQVLVTDFEDGVDHIGLRWFHSFDQLTIADSSEGAVITYYDTSPMLLAGISASQVTREDFLVIG